MTNTALATQLDLFAEDLPDHTAQLASYEQLGLDRRDAFSLEVHAAKILTITRRSVLEIGQELLEARGKAQHGSWTPFLERIGFEQRSAENYMNVARRFGDKPEIISALPATALYALAAPSADPEIVEQIIEEAATGATFKVKDIERRLAPERTARPAPSLPSLTSQPTPLDLATTPLEQAIEAKAAPARTAPVQTEPTATPMPPALDLMPRPAHPLAPAVEIASVDDTPPSSPTSAVAAPALEILAPPAATELPPTLNIPASAPEPADDIEELKLLAAKYHLLSAALDEIQAEMQLAAREDMPTISISAATAGNAARLFLATPAFVASASMLAFSAVVDP